MYIVHVQISVKSEYIEHFKTASIKNASLSIKESGITRFDVIQMHENPSQFVLVEVYRSEQDAVLHKETDHYKIWRDTVAGMMAEPRNGIKYTNIYPSDEGWE